MMVGRGEGQPAAGGPAHHIPVLLDEVVSALCVKEGGVYLDGTFGAGGAAKTGCSAGIGSFAISSGAKAGDSSTGVTV